MCAKTSRFRPFLTIGKAGVMSCLLVASAQAATVRVNVGDNFFSPTVSNIKVNDTVRWVWVGNNEHSTTSSGGLWDSGEKRSGEFSRQFTSAGNFPYFCTVHAGQTGRISVTQPPPPVDPAALGDGVDLPALTWTTGGAAGWINQNGVTHDHVDAVQSGRIGHRGTSWIETTVTGPGTLRFWWKVSSEPNDRLRLLVDGQQKARISGQTAWQRPVIRLGPGTHVLRWSYSKNAAVTAGRDRGWLDQVQFVP
jgi:plastocyanin